MPRLSNIPALTAALLALLLAACSHPVPAPQSAEVAPEGASALTRKPGWRFARQAVAAAHPLAAAAGADVLRAGGHAVDAAVAAQFVLGVVEPQSSGVGGGAFMLVHDGRDVKAYDGRETAPRGAHERLFMDDNGKPLSFERAVTSGRAVGVPGAVAMLELAHRAHGRLPWSTLVAPAIRLAEEGFEVTPRLHTLLAQDPHLRRHPAASALYYDPNGKAWPVGYRLRNPALAQTLRQIASEGARALQQGPIATAMAEAVRQHPRWPGTLDEQDLRDYRPRVREALCHRLEAPPRRYRVCGFPPPSSGGIAVGQILGLLQAAQAVAPVAPRSVPWLHRYTEASRLAFADRALYVADPDFIEAPGGDWARLLAPSYLRERARLIGERAMPVAPAGRPGGVPMAWGPMPEQPERGTSHISVVDASGQAVALTTTIESAFGNRVLVAGFLLNNQLTDFSFTPYDGQGRPVANRVEPGKRPRSSMAPTLVFDESTGELVLSTGSPGGAMIIHYTANALHGILLEDLTPQAAIDRPHLGTTGGPLLLEQDRFPSATVDALRGLGHTVQEVALTSGVQALLRRGDRLLGGADPRREGTVAGD